MIAPIAIAFELAWSPEHAFAVWKSRIGSWWPADHTVSGDPAAVVLEGVLGGRMYERARDGTEFDWGRVTAWDPPHELGYTWHLKRDPTDATDVRVRFLPVAEEHARVDIEHHGWERLGSAAGAMRARNVTGWETLLPHFVSAIDREHA